MHAANFPKARALGIPLTLIEGLVGRAGFERKPVCPANGSFGSLWDLWTIIKPAVWRQVLADFAMSLTAVNVTLAVRRRHLVSLTEVQKMVTFGHPVMYRKSVCREGWGTFLLRQDWLAVGSIKNVVFQKLCVTFLALSDDRRWMCKLWQISYRII